MKDKAFQVVSSVGNRLLAPPRSWRGSVINHGPRSAQRIALTFDDGPSEPSTGYVLDALADVAVAATFFCVGDMAERHPDMVRRIRDGGHEVGSHSMSHSRMRGMLPFGADHMDESVNVLRDVLGESPKLYRAPWGWSTPWDARRAAKRGMRVVGWDVYPDDWQTPEVDAARIVDQVLAGVRPGSIVLLHDALSHVFSCDRTESAKAVRQLVPRLTDAGYEFVTAGELIGATSRPAPPSVERTRTDRARTA